MVGIAEIKAGYDGAKAALDILKGVQSLQTETAKNQAVIDVQRLVIEAQQGLSTGLAQIGELEAEIAHLKDWSAEKERYELKSIGARAVAYAEKDGVENPSVPHWLCQFCFDASEKSALQFSKVIQPGGALGLMAVWVCGNCESEILTGAHATPAGDEG